MDLNLEQPSKKETNAVFWWTCVGVGIVVVAMTVNSHFMSPINDAFAQIADVKTAQAVQAQEISDMKASLTRIEDKVDKLLIKQGINPASIQ